MAVPIIVLGIIAFCSVPCWLAWRQTLVNYGLNKKSLWAIEDLKTLIIEREHEAGYVAGTADERAAGAERAADIVATAVTVAAKAAAECHESNVFDPDNNLVARIRPTGGEKGGLSHAV